MKTWIQIFIVSAVAFSMGSCSAELRPFTSQTLREGNWSDAELRKIQFYSSADIVIQRQLTEGSNEILAGGSIKMVKGQRVEQVKILRGTPGVFISRGKDDHFAVSFDASNEQRFLMFGPNPKRQGTYVLLASEWKDHMGKLHYADKFYWADEPSAFAALLVDLQKIRHVEVQSKTEQGRKVQ